MQNGYGRTALLLSLVFVFTACAGGISDQARAQVTFVGPFSDVQPDPAKYQGETMLWGGKIIETQVKEGVTDISVLQLELGSYDRPRNDDRSHGRFLIRSTRFLDPALYPQGTLITVVGRLQGFETRPIGQMPYKYPVIDPIEIKKWPVDADPSPRFQFGIGIGTHF
jgi:outer membrane lipoprotein